jgi:hypothetical protein
MLIFNVLCAENYTAVKKCNFNPQIFLAAAIATRAPASL